MAPDVNGQSSCGPRIAHSSKPITATISAEAATLWSQPVRWGVISSCRPETLVNSRTQGLSIDGSKTTGQGRAGSDDSPLHPLGTIPLNRSPHHLQRILAGAVSATSCGRPRAGARSRSFGPCVTGRRIYTLIYRQLLGFSPETPSLQQLVAVPAGPSDAHSRPMVSDY